MNKLHRVLAAVDYSEAARAAFDHAVALSRLHDAELTAVHAVPSERPFKWHARERIALIASLREAARAARVRFKVSVQHGDPAGVILLHANARAADLIVLGTSERSALDRLRFGSIAERVALDATQPVLVVPAAATPTQSTTPFNNVVVAIDFGTGSSGAVESALSMANGTSRVTVVHVVRGVPPETASRYMYYLMEPEYQRQVARDAWQRMPDVIPAEARASRQVHARVITGDPAAGISRVAAEVDADLIVVGVTTRGAIGRLLLGSTTARVLRTAGRPVLAVPQLMGKVEVPFHAAKPLAAAA